MRIRHSAVTSNVLELVGTYELDVDLGSELAFPVRIELLRDTGRKNWFRARIWEFEHFNLNPTFPTKKNGKALRYKATELLMLERGTQLSGDYQMFKAGSPARALKIVTEDLQQRLAHWTGRSV